MYFLGTGKLIKAAGLHVCSLCLCNGLERAAEGGVIAGSIAHLRRRVQAVTVMWSYPRRCIILLSIQQKLGQFNRLAPVRIVCENQF